MAQLKYWDAGTSTWKSINVGGEAVPDGGTTGQHLTKTSATDYATAWEGPYTASNGIAKTSYNFALSNVGCKVRLTSTAAVANNSLTATISFSSSNSSEDYDTDSFHSTASNTNRLTVPFAGKYLVTGYLAFAANANGLRWALINHESTGTAYGTVAVQSTNTIGSIFETGLSVSAIVDCAANDYFRLFAYQNSGGSLNAAVGTQFAITYLGA